MALYAPLVCRALSAVLYGRDIWCHSQVADVSTRHCKDMDGGRAASGADNKASLASSVSAKAEAARVIPKKLAWLCQHRWPPFEAFQSTAMQAEDADRRFCEHEDPVIISRDIDWMWSQMRSHQPTAPVVV